MVGLNEQRKQANLKISRILGRLDIGKKYPEIIDAFEWLMQSHPQQRASQLFCNYICGDYRNKNVSEETKEIMEALFPGNPDPFYEEPDVTLKRLRKNITSEFAITEHTKADDISNISLSNSFIEEVSEKLGKTVYFDMEGICKIGKLIGIREQDSNARYHYIIETKNGRMYVPITYSITPLKETKAPLFKTSHELFVCECNNTEHQLIFSHFEDDEARKVYVSVHLTPEWNIWKRIKMAIKYIFGYKCRYGHFDEFIFNPNDAERLQKVVDFLKY